MSVPALFSLIKSLNPWEQRYFRQYAKRHGKGEDKLYVQLFNALNRMQTYDENQLILQFRGTGLEKHLTAYRHHLYQLLLNALLQIRESTSPQAWIHARLDEAELLAGRKLYAQALKIVQRARKKAIAADLNYYLPEILRRERVLLKNQVKTGLGVLMAEMKEMEREALDRLQQESKLQHWSDYLFAVSREKIEGGVNEWKKEYKKALARFPVRNESEISSFHGKLTYNLAHAFLLLLAGNEKQALRRHRHMIDLFESEQGRIETDPWKYGLHLIECLKLQFMAGDYENFLELTEKLTSLRGITRDQARRAGSFANQMLLLYYLNHKMYKQGIALAESMTDDVKNQETSDPRSFVGNSFNISLLYFMVKNYSAAQKWLNRILHMDKMEIRVDVQRFARIFQLMIQTEIGNDDLVHPYLLNLKRNLGREATEFESAIFQQLGLLVSVKGRKSVQASWQEFYQLLLSKKSWAASEVGYPIVKHWVESKLSGQPGKR